MLPYIVVIGAIKHVQNAMLLKRVDNRITSYSAGTWKEEKKPSMEHGSARSTED